MIVQQILKGKPTAGVITVKPGTSVAAAAQVLSENRIGSVVISTDGKQCAGILSERDIVRELGKRGPTCMSDKVEEMMTKIIETCGLSDQSESVLERMTEGRFRHMPVMDDGAMIGIITIGDVVKARLTELAMEKDALQGMIMGH
ncbi:CBS domain-containing protein [Tropicimonas isoalkanivorans]|uniref:CBS domain-containing protein n=1 Tax=Tropicimonas isoalkanivorans TaxID=441112 RepID=A0A1I1E179_9RHOB|nr:CBS domain-containing protein [Tropicimonas isoalkanivorans]SFB80955.1 CBS domain-containing protein [Tropicimonas isoalkanivorans]